MKKFAGNQKDQEIAEGRRDEVLKHLLETPPKPHKPTKGDKSPAKDA